MKVYKRLKYYKDKTALILDNGETYSYRNVLKKSNLLSNFFFEREIVFLLVDNNLESILALIACDIKNSVVMLLPSKIDKLALNNLIKSYNPKIIFSKSISKIKHKNFIKKKIIMIMRF